jgi:hypothetical protein
MSLLFVKIGKIKAGCAPYIFQKLPSEDQPKMAVQ